MLVFLNLCKGLDRLGAKYRVNDYGYINKHSDELACIIGKPFVLDKIKWKNPILLGASVYSHPVDDLNLLMRFDVRKILVPGPWMEEMCKPYWGDTVSCWPVGIDTYQWKPCADDNKNIDILLYDKVRWNHDYYQNQLLEPIRQRLIDNKINFQEIRYGHYQENDFRELLKRCKAMVFLCEHETQGIAYQQALSAGVPILAWDRGGPWQDPAYYPDKVVFGPVTAVPYWDERCGDKFTDAADFEYKLDSFISAVNAGVYKPRDYILENLTLEKCAARYLDFVNECR